MVVGVLQREISRCRGEGKKRKCGYGVGGGEGKEGKSGGCCGGEDVVVVVLGKTSENRGD